MRYAFYISGNSTRLLHYLEQSDESVKLLKYLLNSSRHI